VARKLLGASSLVHVSHSAIAAGRRLLLPAMSTDQGYGGQHQSPQIELALVNAVADDLGRPGVWYVSGTRLKVHAA